MKKPVCLILLLYALAAVFTLIFCDGTGDAGDSVNHYLFARYAPSHPELYFHHWAKPVYVLLASPFAQFGFTGVKVFNVLVSMLCIWLTFKSAEALKYKHAVTVALITAAAPMYYVLTFSGLTEPLFALFIAAGLYLCIRKHYMAAALLISFLPFVRSEGLILCGVFGLFFLAVRQWRVLPLLLSGHVVYSLAGYFVYHDLLWVFTKIPYASLSSPYGHGGPFHFAVQLLYVIGLPIYILFGLGMIRIGVKILMRKAVAEELILIFSGFIAFFTAHTLFWYLGIFNSMGLNRVLIGVMPLVALIALQGYNLLAEDLAGNRRKLSTGLQWVLSCFILLFPFLGTPSSIKWKKDMMLNTDQRLGLESAQFIRSSVQTIPRIMCAHPYMSMALDVDRFDRTKWLNFNKENIDTLKKGDLVVWENWFAVVEEATTQDYLDHRGDLENIYTTKNMDKEREIVYKVYRKK